MCLEITQHLQENDQTRLVRNKIVKTFDLDVLVDNLNKIYINFLDKYGGEYLLSNEEEMEYGF